MLLRLAGPLVMAALVSAGCGRDVTNPFEDEQRTEVPGTEAALLFTSNAFATSPGVPRDLHAVNEDGAELARLTYCNTTTRRCDTLEAASDPDRERVAARRVLDDTDGDGRLSERDDAVLVVIDLVRGIEAPLLDADWRIDGVDWSPVGQTIVFSARAPGSELEDLYRVDSNGGNLRQLTLSDDVRERHPRIDPTGTVAVYELGDSTRKSQIWIFSSSEQQLQLTSGGVGSEPLPGTPYVVGADADPAFSPDNQFVVFRRLMSTRGDGQGGWDIMTVRTDGSEEATLVTGPGYRGAPDWGPGGIVFAETGADGIPRLVVIQPDGSGRSVPVTVGAGFTLSHPRWLP
jgi:dipeptidyl aminopeptidase/acylaminoacyl peptidase